MNNILILSFLIILYFILTMKKQITGGRQENKKTQPLYAFVTLMFGGDSYLPGVLTLAYSIQKTDSKYDVICMITDDVSSDAINEMKKQNIIVVNVPYLEYKSKPMSTAKQQAAYKWMSKSYTKWNCLTLTKYNKILFLDADMLVKKNIDHIFNLYKAPAARFTNEIYKTKYNWKLSVQPSEIKYILKNRLPVGNASIMLLSPNINHFNNLKKMIKSMEPFGFNSLSGMDEQSIAFFMSVYDTGPKLPWDNIDAKYESSWRSGESSNEAYILNFTGTVKPWERNLSNEFTDTKYWYVINEERINSILYNEHKQKKHQ